MKTLIVTAVASIAFVGVAVVAQQVGPAGRDWPAPQGDSAGTRFSTLSQINANNVTNLQVAWTFHTGSGRFSVSPMVVDGVMYFSAPNGVYAIDGTTGKQIWKFVPPPLPAGDAPPPGRGGGGGRGGGRGGGADSAGTALRGPVYWAGAGAVKPRIYSTTTNGLAAIDAATGEPIGTFGKGGYLSIRPNSPAMIYKNILMAQGGRDGDKGDTIKGFDIVTGELKWTFYLKAQPGDPNRATWLDGSADSPATPNLWGMFTVDSERGILYAPIEKTGNDYWGGSNHGNILYSNSLVAIDALTGKMKWYQQLVHHDIWDYDIAAAPLLFDVKKDGKTIPAVAQQTKMALLFIFNRETGEPIFGVEERKVPQTTAPGEWTSPTQPFPVKPEPLARNSLTHAELAKVTPELEAFCENLWQKYKLQDTVPYQPWQVGQDIIVFPGAQGGGNWHGAAFNPELGLIITNVMDAGQWGHLTTGGGRRGAPPPDAAATPDPAAQAAGSLPAGVFPPAMNKQTPEGGRFWDPANRYSCSAPPWGQLVAVNANTGDIAWRVPLGEYEELTARGVPKTGTPSSGGAITTAGNLIFIGATIDGYFRAFDARDGRELWKDKLPNPSQSTPTTYLGKDGRQYVVIPANGGGFFGAPTGDAVVAYALPSATATTTPAAGDAQKAATPASSGMPDAPGKAETIKACSTCHDADAHLTPRRTNAEWATVIDDMISRGADLNDKDYAAVLAYLTKYYGKAPASKPH